MSPPARRSRRSTSAMKSWVSRAEPALRPTRLTPNTPMLRRVRSCRGCGRFRRGTLLTEDRQRGHAGAEEPAVADDRRGLGERHCLGHEMRRRDGPVEPVREHRDGSHRDFALDHPAGPQPLGDGHAARAQAAHGHRRRRRRERAGQRLGQIGGQKGGEARVDRRVELAVISCGPANLGTTPSSDGASTAGRSWMLAIRQGSDTTRLPTVTRPRTASAKSSTHSPAFHAGRNPHRSRSREVSISGALCTSCSSANAATGVAQRPQLPPIRTMGRPSAAAS